MTSGERVRIIRKKLKLSLEKFGEILGVKKSAISAIETNKNALTEQMAKAICREFNVDYDWLVHGTGDQPFTDLPKIMLEELCRQHGCDKFDRQLIAFYLDLSPDERQMIQQVIRRLFAHMQED